jgi:class 3 adenylate cyclase
MKPTIKFVKRKDGVRLAYSIFGSGPGLIYVTPWVTDLAHFLEDTHTIKFWNDLARSFTIVIYDKHGCGQSDRDRTQFSLEGELQDLETIVDHVELDKFILFGMSCAGPVAITYASQNPDKITQMILYATWANGNDIAREDVRSAIVNMIKASWGIGSKTIAELFVPNAPPEIQEQLTKFQRVSCSPEMAAELLHLGYSIDVTSLIPGINIPTLILHREGDKTAPVREGRRLASDMPNCCFNVFQGDIHLPWLGNSSEIIDAIRDFVGIEKPFEMTVGSQEIDTEERDTAEQATIVFTDIVSSTDLVNKLGDVSARDIFIKHDKLVRNQIEKYGGKELQNLGDGFMLSFESASSAIKCVSDIQKEISISLQKLSIRIGVNTGEVIRREGKHPFGQAVVIASRILAKCKGGQILVSDITKKLVAGSKFSFLEKEQFVPKGFDESISLYEVVWKNNEDI